MKAKFGMSGNNEPSGINVAFKLPCGSKTQYIFQENSTMKVSHAMIDSHDNSVVLLFIEYVSVCSWKWSVSSICFMHST